MNGIQFLGIDRYHQLITARCAVSVEQFLKKSPNPVTSLQTLANKIAINGANGLIASNKSELKHTGLFLMNPINSLRCDSFHFY